MYFPDLVEKKISYYLFINLNNTKQLWEFINKDSDRLIFIRHGVIINNENRFIEKTLDVPHLINFSFNLKNFKVYEDETCLDDIICFSDKLGNHIHRIKSNNFVIVENNKILGRRSHLCKIYYSNIIYNLSPIKQKLNYFTNSLCDLAKMRFNNLHVFDDFKTYSPFMAGGIFLGMISRWYQTKQIINIDISKLLIKTILAYLFILRSIDYINSKINPIK
tara:strand:- start:1451 stop:2110 length:660 start_codon:yes stop_codon:yes gene_type:complete